MSGTSLGEGSLRWSTTVAAPIAACSGVVGSLVSAVSLSPVVREMEFLVAGLLWLCVWPSAVSTRDGLGGARVDVRLGLGRARPGGGHLAVVLALDDVGAVRANCP